MAEDTTATAQASPDAAETGDSPFPGQDNANVAQERETQWGEDLDTFDVSDALQQATRDETSENETAADTGSIFDPNFELEEEADSTETEEAQAQGHLTEQAEDDTEQQPDTDAAAQDDADPEEDDALPKRLRLNFEKLNGVPERDKAIIALMRKRNISYDAARNELFGETPAPTSQKEDASLKDASTPESNDALAALDKEINELVAQRENAADEYQHREYAKLTTQIEEKRDALRELKFEQKLKQQQAQQTVAQQVQTSMERAVEAFPEIGEPGSVFRTAIESDIQRLESTNPAFFHDPDWPETLAAKHAMRLGKVPAKAQQTGQQPSKPDVQARRASRPVQSPPSPSPGGVSVNGAQSTGRVDPTNMSPQQLAAYLSDPKVSEAEQSRRLAQVMKATRYSLM